MRNKEIFNWINEAFYLTESIADPFLRDKYLSRERGICLHMCVSRRLSRMRIRDICRSNRLYNEMSAYSPVDGKILNERKLYCPTVERAASLLRWRNATLRWWREYEPFAIQRETSLFRRGIECSWHRFMKYQFNDRDSVHAIIQAGISPVEETPRRIENKSRVVTLISISGA